MSFKTILVPIERPKSATPALRYALGLASDLGAHVEVFHPQTDPALVLPPVLDGMSGIAFAPELLAQAQRAADELRAEIKAMIEATLVDLGYAEIPRGRHPGFSLAMDCAIGAPERLVARRGRVADVTIVARPPLKTSRGESDSLNGALWSSARPVLMVPGVDDNFSAAGKRPDRIVVAWNGSAEAARALASALPLLVQAVTVDVVAFDGAVDADGLARVAAYLETHGIAARTADIKSEGFPLSKVLFDRAIEREADLIVMGAYTHSRLREYLIGGLTQEIMDGSPIPVLFAH